MFTGMMLSGKSLVKEVMFAEEGLPPFVRRLMLQQFRWPIKSSVSPSPSISRQSEQELPLSPVRLAKESESVGVYSTFPILHEPRITVHSEPLSAKCPQHGGSLMNTRLSQLP